MPAEATATCEVMTRTARSLPTDPRNERVLVAVPTAEIVRATLPHRAHTRLRLGV